MQVNGKSWIVPAESSLRRIPVESWRRLQELHALDWGAKVQHWAKVDPWEGMRLPNGLPVERFHVSNIRGDVTGAACAVIGKPCFGIPTAILLREHERRTWYNGRFMLSSRCGRCVVSNECSRIANARISADLAASHATTHFRALGGSQALRGDGPTLPELRTAYRQMIEALQRSGPFESILDPIAIAFGASVLERRSQNAVKRSSVAQRRVAREHLCSGELPEEIRKIIDAEARIRARSFFNYRRSGTAPKQVTKGEAHEQTVFTVKVWRHKTSLELQKQNVTAYRIATLLGVDKEYEHLTHGSIRSRVGAALRRIDLLERPSSTNGGLPIWPKLSQLEALRKLTPPTTN
jgi:hypothetical protein